MNPPNNWKDQEDLEEAKKSENSSMNNLHEVPGEDSWDESDYPVAKVDENGKIYFTDTTKIN